MDTKAKIEKVLNITFAPSKLVVEDNSRAHAGHEGVRSSGGGHFDVSICSAHFRGRTTLERHRMIHDALFKGPLGRQIHALRIKASSPEESGP